MKGDEMEDELKTVNFDPESKSSPTHDLFDLNLSTDEENLLTKRLNANESKLEADLRQLKDKYETLSSSWYGD